MATADRPLGAADTVGHLLAGLVCVAFGHSTCPAVPFCLWCGTDTDPPPPPVLVCEVCARPVLRPCTEEQVSGLCLHCLTGGPPGPSTMPPASS